MKNMVFIITEANETVATGHFSEALTIANMLCTQGVFVTVLVNEDIQKPLLEAIKCPYKFYADIRECVRAVKECSIVITDLRRVDNKLVSAIKHKNNTTVICIDELGFTKLDCDVIINNIIDPYYHIYNIAASTRLYAGAEYMIMKPQFAQIAKIPRKANPTIENITICMGGADTPGTTMHVLSSLVRFDGEVNVVVGGGFAYKSELTKFIKSNINIHYNISNIYDIFLKSDLAFCSGGNVLYELACVGTPAVTVYTNPHEKRSADCFSSRGFGQCIGQAKEITSSDVTSAIGYFESTEIRQKHLLAGKSIVDGRAIDRVWNIIRDYLIT